MEETIIEEQVHEKNDVLNGLQLNEVKVEDFTNLQIEVLQLKHIIFKLIMLNHKDLEVKATKKSEKSVQLEVGDVSIVVPLKGAVNKK